MRPLTSFLRFSALQYITRYKKTHVQLSSDGEVSIVHLLLATGETDEMALAYAPRFAKGDLTASHL